MTDNVIVWGAWVNTVISLIVVDFILFIVGRACPKTKTPPAPNAVA
jgi:large conductance mechanosensitive channel